MQRVIPCIVLKIIQGIVKNISGKFVSYMVLLKTGKTCVPGVGEDTYQEDVCIRQTFRKFRRRGSASAGETEGILLHARIMHGVQMRE